MVLLGKQKKAIIVITFVEHSLNGSEMLPKKDVKPHRLSRENRL